MWIRKEGAFQSIVPGETFYTAQGIMRARARRYSNEELIERLRNLYRNRGFLSGLVIDETGGMPSSSVYMYRFGSLIRAYQTVGFTPGRDYRYLETNRFLRQLHPEIIAQTEKKIADLGGTVLRDPATDICPAHWCTVPREARVPAITVVHWITGTSSRASNASHRPSRDLRFATSCSRVRPIAGHGNSWR